MAIFAIGAYYESKYDKSEEFLQRKCACIGWDEENAPALFQIFRTVKNGDIIYLKKLRKHREDHKAIYILHIGIVTDNTFKEFDELGTGVTVEWIASPKKEFLFKERYNVTNNTLYEEHNPEVQKFIIDEILSTISSSKNS